MSKKRTMYKRRDFLLGLGTIAGMATIAYNQYDLLQLGTIALENNERNWEIDGEKTLKERAAAKGLIYGSAAQYDQLNNNPLYRKLFLQECEFIVPEWEMKWSSGNKLLRPSPDTFEFKASDWMINFAQNNNLLFRGHTLVWHRALPKWFKEKVSKQNAESLLTNHIETVMGRYAGKIHSWDVVNEAIAPWDNMPNGLRKTPWLEFLGTDYIDFAFRVAAKADPKALLVYNDYGLYYDNSKDEKKRQAVLSLLERLKSKGTPIHALGIQSHLSGDRKIDDLKKFRYFLQDVASMGLKILITELDVKDQKLPFDINERDRIVAAAYEDYLSVVLDEQAVIAVLTWGLSDRYTWLNEFKPRADRAPSRPLPLDAQMQRKLAWNAIARAFDHAAKR